MFFVFFNETATTEIHSSWHTLYLHDALPISPDATIASISRSGTPHNPKPPATSVIPSFNGPSSAASALGNILFMTPLPFSFPEIVKRQPRGKRTRLQDRKSTRLNSSH